MTGLIEKLEVGVQTDGKSPWPIRQMQHCDELSRFLLTGRDGRDHLFAVDADSSHSILADDLLDEGPSANGEPRMLSDDASRQPGRRRLRRVVADTPIAGAPIAAASAWASQEKRHAECDQQERADEVKRANGDKAKVLGDAE